MLLKDAENCVSMMEAKVEKTSHTAIQYNRTFKYIALLPLFKVYKNNLIKYQLF